MTSPLGLGHRRQDVTSPGPTTNHDDDDSIGNKAATAAPEAAQSLSLMHLPPEMHVAISDFLTYPDALSLKHTNRHFYSLVDTDFELKIEWLLQRRSLHLECPSNHRCALGSDLRFCRGSVPLLMQRRREHMECDSRPGLGCLVYGTSTCTHGKREGGWRSWLRDRLTLELWWTPMAGLLAALVWAWMA